MLLENISDDADLPDLSRRPSEEQEIQGGRSERHGELYDVCGVFEHFENIQLILQ